MGTVRTGTPGLIRPGARPRARGFTLIELLVVLAMIGFLIGIAALSARPDPVGRLKRDADRLQALFTLAADEAALRSAPLGWQAGPAGYQFVQASRAGWTAVSRDEDFRARNWEAGSVRINLVPAQLPATRRGDRPPGWIEFPRDGSQPPFVLELRIAEGDGAGAGGWSVRGTGRGTYFVEALN